MAKRKLRLGVNVDHVATLREARGANYPSPLEAAHFCIAAGAYGITIHLREDRRHIQDADLFDIRRQVAAPLNLEMANAPAIIKLALEAKPAEVCLVPEKRQELTTEGGLDVVGQLPKLNKTISRLTEAGIKVSLFVDPDKKQIEAAAATEASMVELHTGTYCAAKNAATRKSELNKLVKAAVLAHKSSLQVNAGHGINLDNIDAILTIPYLDTLNIGHSIVARAVMVGMKAAVKEINQAMRRYDPPVPA